MTRTSWTSHTCHGTCNGFMCHTVGEVLVITSEKALNTTYICRFKSVMAQTPSTQCIYWITLILQLLCLVISFEKPAPFSNLSEVKPEQT